MHFTGSFFTALLKSVPVFGCAAGGTGTGQYCSGKKGVQSFLEPLVLLMKALPVAAFIIVMLIWFGSQNAAVTIGFMVVFPMVYQAVLEGACAADTKLLEMAAVFELSPVKRCVIFMCRRLCRS